MACAAGGNLTAEEQSGCQVELIWWAIASNIRVGLMPLRLAGRRCTQCQLPIGHAADRLDNHVILIDLLLTKSKGSEKMLTLPRGSPTLRDCASFTAPARKSTTAAKRADQGGTGICGPTTSVGQSHYEHPEEGKREKQK